MKYIVEIKGSNETISFNKENGLWGHIESVLFKLNTIDDDTLERDNGTRCEFTIEGKIDEKSHNEVKKIAKWAVSKNDVHRDIEITVIDENNSGNPEVPEKYRVYKFDRIFCIDFSEEYSKNDNKFRLFMAQSQNHSKQIISE